MYLFTTSVKIRMKPENWIGIYWKSIIQWLDNKDFWKNVISDKKITYQNFWCNKVWCY
jgi:hypothetical protein